MAPSTLQITLNHAKIALTAKLVHLQQVHAQLVIQDTSSPIQNANYVLITPFLLEGLSQVAHLALIAKHVTLLLDIVLVVKKDSVYRIILVQLVEVDSILLVTAAVKLVTQIVLSAFILMECALNVMLASLPQT